MHGFRQWSGRLVTRDVPRQQRRDGAASVIQRGREPTIRSLHVQVVCSSVSQMRSRVAWAARSSSHVAWPQAIASKSCEPSVTASFPSQYVLPYSGTHSVWKWAASRWASVELPDDSAPRMATRPRPSRPAPSRQRTPITSQGGGEKSLTPLSQLPVSLHFSRCAADDPSLCAPRRGPGCRGELVPPALVPSRGAHHIAVWPHHSPATREIARAA